MDHKPGDVVNEMDGLHEPLREVFVRKNPKKSAGMDTSIEQLMSCSLCERKEWVKAYSRSAKWTKSHAAARFMTVRFCPDHRREAQEFDRTLTQVFTDNTQDLVDRVKDRVTAQKLEQGPSN